MSHYTVLVIGENPEEQLAPFQENNMGDCPKEFMKFRVWDTEGNDHWFDSEEQFKTSGIKVEDDGYWENPNRKWDWYSLGGRWTGFFKLRQGVTEIVGRPGLMTVPAEPGYGDQCRKYEVDFAGMRDVAGKLAQDKYELAMSFLDVIPLNEKWESVRERIENRDEARGFYWNQERCKVWKEKERDNINNDQWPFGWHSSPDEFLVSQSDYIENARNSAVTTHAVIKDGKWYESGSMGWWGAISNEKDKSVWNAEFSKLIDELPEDALLSVYDCHI